MWTNLVEEENADEEVREIYGEIKRTLKSPDLPNWVKALGGNAKLLKANWEKTKNTLVHGELPLALKELIIFKVSVENGSQYCMSCHAHSALQLDKSLSYEDLERLAAGAELGQLPRTYRVALEIIPRVTLAPETLSDEDLRKLKEVGFSPAAITELFAQGDLAVMFNTITKVYRVPIDAAYKSLSYSGSLKNQKKVT